MIRRILGNASGWVIAALLGITVYAGMQAREYALQLSETEARLVRSEERAQILREHQRWQREQIDKLNTVLTARDEQIESDVELVEMMRSNAQQLERDDATTSDWAGQPVPDAVGSWVRELPADSDGAGSDDARGAQPSGADSSSAAALSQPQP